MITDANQRWRERRGTYRPAGEVIRTSDYEVAEIAQDGPAKAFVEHHHYLGTFPAARFRFGLYTHGSLVGVAIFSQPMNDASLKPLPPEEAAELGRLVLLDQVPGNGESWFVSRCFDQLRREGLAGVVSFSDPVARDDASGQLVFRGHIGNVYQALSAVHLGRGTARTHRLLPDGSIVCPRTLQKIRRRERGFRYAAAQLERWGAAPLNGDGRAWLADWLPRLTRPLRHPGNFKYAWGFTRGARKALPRSQPYPKVGLPQQSVAGMDGPLPSLGG